MNQNPYCSPNPAADERTGRGFLLRHAWASIGGLIFWIVIVGWLIWFTQPSLDEDHICLRLSELTTGPPDDPETSISFLLLPREVVIVAAAILLALSLVVSNAISVLLHRKSGRDRSD